MRNEIYIICISLLLFSGCAKLGAKVMGDDQLVKGEIKKIDNVELAGIKEAVADIQGQISAQAGLINKTVSDMRETSAGRDSVMNDPEMINKFILVFGIVIGLPFLGVLLIMIIYILSSERKQKDMNKHYAKLIEAIKNDPNMVINK